MVVDRKLKMKTETQRTTGRLPEILLNQHGDLYAGNLAYYFAGLFRSKGVCNPYHNFRHSGEVFVKVYFALQFYSTAGKPVDKNVARWLLIAALLHDINHPGRSGNDDLNIEFSVRAMDKILLPEDRQGFEVIKLFMRTTEFGVSGHVHTVGSIMAGYEELERVIRDADISQCFSLAWIQLICFGLSSEIGITPEQMLRGQGAFLRGMKMQSEWGCSEFNAEVIASKIEEVKSLVSILDTGLATRV